MKLYDSAFGTPFSQKREELIAEIKQAIRDGTPSSATCPSDFHLGLMAQSVLDSPRIAKALKLQGMLDEINDVGGKISVAFRQGETSQ